jgi:hypothetical protein
LVLMHCHLCLSCHRTSSRRSIVVCIVVDVVVVGLDVNVVGGFNASSKPFVPPPRLLPPLRRHCCHSCHCCHHRCHHCLCHRGVIVVVVVLIIVVSIFFVIVVVVVRLCPHRCPIIMRATQ